MLGLKKYTGELVILCGERDEIVGAQAASSLGVVAWFTIALAAAGTCEGPVWATVGCCQPERVPTRAAPDFSVTPRS